MRRCLITHRQRNQLIKIQYNKTLNIYFYNFIVEVFRENKHNGFAINLEMYYRPNKTQIWISKAILIGVIPQDELTFKKLGYFNTDIHKREKTGYFSEIKEEDSILDNIYEKIKEIISLNNNIEDVFMIIWNYIKTSDNEIYINLLSLFDKGYLETMIDNLWDNYINNKEWDPPKYIYENNLLILNDEYEMYCEYTKWKRGINNINKIWIKYKHEHLIILLNNKKNSITLTFHKINIQLHFSIAFHYCFYLT